MQGHFIKHKPLISEKFILYPVLFLGGREFAIFYFATCVNNFLIGLPFIINRQTLETYYCRNFFTIDLRNEQPFTYVWQYYFEIGNFREQGSLPYFNEIFFSLRREKFFREKKSSNMVTFFDNTGHI